MRIDIITVLPELLKSPFEASILKRAIEKDLVSTNSTINQKQYKFPMKKTYKNELIIKSGYELRNDFLIKRNWFGQNKRFAVRFKRGNYQNETYYYDHDYVYQNARQHLENIPSFQKYGFNVSTSNIPGYAIDHLKII